MSMHVAKVVGKRQEHKGQLLLQIFLVKRVNLLKQTFYIYRVDLGLKALVIEYVESQSLSYRLHSFTLHVRRYSVVLRNT